MKRILCFILSFALCLGLCPVGVWAEGDEAEPNPGDGGFIAEADETEPNPDDDGFAAEADGTESDPGDGESVQGTNTGTVNGGFSLDADKSSDETHPVENVYSFVTNGFTYTYTGTNSPAIRVAEGGKLTFSGTVVATGTGGSGIAVESGGSLTVTDAAACVKSEKMFALNIASGAEVHLSGGTYDGRNGAIMFNSKKGTAADYAGILELGYAFFDQAGNLLLPGEAVGCANLTVGKCGHTENGWTHEGGDLIHTCSYCGKQEKCTFIFEQNGNGSCVCGNSISVAVNEEDLTGLVYDGTVQPQDVRITVTLTDGSGKELENGTDYTVDYTPQKDAGEVTVKVIGVTFSGIFTKTFNVAPDQPGIKWHEAACAVNYDGEAVEKDDLPSVIITIRADEDLHPYLQYSYRKAGETEFTPGLPKNAGTYEVKAYIPASQNYTAAETNPCLTLTINKITAVTAAPTAKTLTYNREAQELATAGVLKPGAVAEGAVIEYKLGTDGAYSTQIPTGIEVSGYSVYYQVSETENYTGVSETLVLNPDPSHQSARINHREITPAVELEYYTTVYNGGDKEPKFTVRDGDYDIPKSEYTFAYGSNRNVGTATLTITNAGNGNYKLTQVVKEFKITLQPQAGLAITDKPNTVTYGDKFTLGHQGGSGNGDVTWEVTAGKDTVATVDEKSGQVAIVGDGSFTVKATKSGKDPATGAVNYDDATASWTVTAVKKPVTATVTAEDKFYDGNKNAVIHAVVESGVLAGDEVTIDGLTGTFEDENAGVGKTVTVNTSGASISGTKHEHYAVTYSSTTVTATIRKAVVHITTAPGAADLTYNGGAQALLDDSVLVIDLSDLPADSDSVRVEYALSESGTYSTDIPKGTDAGVYTVWYRVRETDNYTGLAPESVDVTINKKPVEPTIELDTESYIYDGNAKEPGVTLYEDDGTTLIPAAEYTVAYSANVNFGTATVTVTAKADGNYTFTNAPVTKTFEIKKEQARVITAPKAVGLPLYFSTYAQELVTEGTGSGGTMVYWVDDGVTDVADAAFSAQIPTETDAKDYKVYYKVEGDGNHSDSEVGSVDVTIAPKTVNNPTIELRDDGGNALVSYTYDGAAKTPTVVVKDGSTVIDAGEYNVVYRNNTDAGDAIVSITDELDGNYTVTGSTTFVIQKADITFTRDPSDAGVTYNGAAQELLIPGTFTGGAVQYALNSQTSTYSDAIPTATNAGAYTVWYKVIGDKNHNDFAARSVTATIKRKPLNAVTVELSPESFAYDGTAKMPAVTVRDGNTVLPEDEYSWTCDVASPSNVGTYTITVSDAANGNYDLTGVTANTKTFTIGKIAQDALVIGGQPAVTNYGDSFQLSVTGGSGDGAVTWEAVGSATVDASGNVTIDDVGEATVTVKKAGDDNHLAAEARYTFTAAPRPVTAVVTVADKVFDGTTGTTVASASIAKVNSNDDVAIELNSIIAAFDTPSVGEGKTVTLDVSKVKVDGADAAKYAVSYPVTVTADITRATTTITTHPAGTGPLTYNRQAQALVTAGVTNIGFIVYSLDGISFSPEIPTGTNAGDYTVHYKVDATADYTGVAVDTIDVTIAAKSITPVVEVKEESYLYDGAKKSPAVTVKDGRDVIDPEQYKVEWENADGVTLDDILTAAGTYKATITSAANGNYAFRATATVEIVAGKQPAISITGQPEHVFYGDTVTTLGTTGGVGNGTVTWTVSGGTNSTINENTGVLEVKDTGELTVTAKRAVPNYETVSNSWTFTVEPKPVTAVVTVADKVYDGRNTASVTSAVVSDLVDAGDRISISGLTAGIFDNANAGSGKTVTLDKSGVSITGDTDKYAVTIPATATASITPRAVDVTVALSDHDLKTDDSGKYYYTFDGAEKTPNVTVKANDDNAALTSGDFAVDYAKNKNAGTADVKVTASAGGNYTFAAETVHFEIRSGAAVLTVTPQAKDLAYNGSAQDLVTVGGAVGGTVVYALDKDGFDKDDVNSYSANIPQGKDAGTYTVWYMVKGDSNHDNTAPGQVSVTIKPREITPKITLSQTSYVYDGNECRPTVTVEDGSVTVPASEYSVSYRDNINAGTATVVVSDNNGGNYIVNGTADFEIKKAAPVFTAPEGISGLKYNGSVQELVKAGVCNDGTVVYSVNGGSYSSAVPSASAVGGYEISYKVLGDANHSNTDAVALGTVTIAKNTVNNPAISLSSTRFQFNNGEQKPTVTVCDDNGLLIPEHEYSVAISGGNMVDVGTYTVTVTTPDSSNYVITANNTRTFEIVPANQETISITGTKAQVRYGDVIQLGTTGGVGGSTVTWTVTGSSDISATGLLTVKDVGGPITVTATRSAGGNYNDVSATWEFSAAKKQVTAVVTVADKAYDGTPDATITSAKVNESDLVGDDTVTITGLTAKFDNENVGQNKTVRITGGPIENDKYEIAIPATTTASITAWAATVNAEPEAVEGLTYDAGQAQELVSGGDVTGGILVYSLDGTNFTPSVPKAKDAGTYTVYFKAQGDGNHSDSAVKSTQATIGRQSVTPQIELSPSAAKYDGGEHKPAVTLRDGANNVIPDSEYKVTYVTDGGANWTDKGDYTVKVENISGGNYVVAATEEPFTISANAQNPLEITGKPGLVYYGDAFTLSAVGGSGNAAVEWSVDNGSVVEIDANGFVKIVGTGSAVIKAEKPGGDNYETATATYPLNALAKPITAVVTADDKVYDGRDSADIHVSFNGLVGSDTISSSALSGKFDSPNVGQNKKVTISGGDISTDKYTVTYNTTTAASILKAETAVPAVAAVSGLKYTGSAQELVTGGNDDTTVYCASRDGVYSASVPTAANAGSYTVWFKELGDNNHNDSAPKSVTVTIDRKELTAPTITLSGNDLQTDADGKYSYVYDGSEKRPGVTIKDGAAVVPAGEYTVGYSNNKNVSTETVKGTVTVSCNEGGNYAFDEQTVTFAITSAAARLTSSPQAKDLTYIGPGQKQELVTTGTADGGHIEYSLDGGEFGRGIPKAEDAGTYTVTYKVVGDGNFASAGETWTVSVTIRQKEIVSPKVTVSGDYAYTGSAVTPTNIKVEDGSTEIPTDEYTVSFRDNVEAGTAAVIITNANGGNYIVNGSGSFTIGKADAEVEAAPVGKTGLPYNGGAQALAEAGSASGGTMVYSLEQNGEYSPVIPTGTAKGAYTVWYKVLGDANHNDSAAASVTASIVVNTVTAPTVQVTPESVTFNGNKQVPAVTIKDDNGQLIDGSEYAVTYADSKGNSDLTQVGTYTLTITAKSGGNYSFTATGSFEILPADQTPLTITGTRERVCYGDMFQLGVSGGSDGGTVAWAVSDGSPASIDTNGLLTITGTGSVTVTATNKADGYSDQTASWSFFAEKKPVTAVVTAENKTYDSTTEAVVTATLQGSDLVSGDTVKIKLSGDFEDANAGTGKTVRVNSSDPKFDGSTGNYQNYSISYPATATASIFKAEVTNITAPTAAENLTYTGLAQALVIAGSSAEGTMEYSTDNITYSAALPTGADADSYDVWYRVRGDGNHNDTAGVQLAAQVTIAPQDVTAPVIELKPSGASYDGAVHKPEVTVKDGNGRVIPDGEYTVVFGDGNWKDVGTYMVTVKDVDGGNYVISEKEAEFKILATGQSTLSISGKPGTVRYGDSFSLSALGGSGTGAIKWEVTVGDGIASIDQNGLVKILKSGSVTITATKLADGNYGESTDSWSFSAEKKPVKAIVTAKNKVFDANDEATLVISWKDGDLLGDDADEITLNLTGKFDDANVGTDKTVTITGAKPGSDKYDISFNTTTTASITQATATATGVTAKTNLIYTGQPLELVSEGSSTNGTIMYSPDNVIYSGNVPKETDAGTYRVWYKVLGNANYADSAPAVLSVTIAQRKVDSPVIELSPKSFDYDGTAKAPSVVVKDGSVVIPIGEYTVSYSNNTNAGTATVTIGNAPGGNYIVNGTATFTIEAGAAVLTSAPEEKDLTYTGSAQALVTKGTAVNGKVMYALNDEDGEYSTTIPKGTNAGTYEVWYMVKGNDGFGDTEPESVTVTIKPKQVTPSVAVGGVPSYSTPYTGSQVTPSVTVVVDGRQLTYQTDYTYSYGNNINPGTAYVTVQSASGSNYQFYATAAFEITKIKAEFALAPRAVSNLVYTGEAQALVRAGIAKTGGTVVYALDGVTYSPAIPKGTDVDDYVVFAKVLGNDTYLESDVVYVDVSISKNTIAAGDLTVELSQSSFKYTGSAHTPGVTLTDENSGKVIPASEYSVSYSSNVNVGSASVTVRSTGKNYSFSKTVSFTITDADAPALTITGKPTDKICYGDTFQLGAAGGSGAVTWSVESGNATAQGGGQFKITGSGSVTIKAEAGVSSDIWTFYANPKPVTAIVTAACKPYDNSTSAVLTVVTVSGLLPGDSIGSGSITVEGQFADAEVGENKTVIITKWTVPADISGKYDISYPESITASITPAAASVKTPPANVSGLTYTGSPLALVSEGEAENGNMMYSLDGKDYSYSVPTGTDAGTYTVWYKAAATNDNYRDSDPVRLTGAAIGVNTDTPTVLCTPNTFQYDSAPKTPAVVVRDSAQRIIPESEYSVVVPAATAVGTYTVTVKDKTGGNYQFSGEVTGTFEIVEASQNPLSITDKPASVFYGDTFVLSAIGGSGSGVIKWSIAESDVAVIDGSGKVTVKGVGGFTVEAYRDASDGYGKSNTDSVPFYADPKPITAVAAAVSRGYNGKKDAAVTVTVPEINATITATGTFDDENAGTGKTVTIVYGEGMQITNPNYQITWPGTTTASIYKVDAKIENAPTAVPNLSFTGSAQDLVAGGTTAGGIGTIVYSTSEKGAYSTSIPTGTGAGTYSVWYKVADSVNYTGVPAAMIEVEIKKADPGVTSHPTAAGSTGKKLSEIPLSGGSFEVSGGRFAWEDDSQTAEVGKAYNVIFTPSDTANYNTVTIQVTVTEAAQSSSSGGGSGGSGGSGSGPAPVQAQTQTTVRNGAASTVLSASDGNRLVQEASQSQNVVIKPEISGNVTKSEVSIPSATVNQLGSGTDASLTVASPVGDVTIPNRALDTLGQAGGSVSVVTEQVGQGVALTLSSGGETVTQVPGGVTLSVPVEDPSPGTVAVIVNEDGTRETVKNSVVNGDVMSIPLSGSATVEIVDNSRDFDDVPAGSWAADAVAFASSHELFNGTSETTFSPDSAMSRGMLATVLYRLEGNPDMELTDAFSDVDDDAWYADGVAWAAANGIAGGYGDSQFGPNDTVTREQFVVMLWRYAGCPEAGSQDLDFTDADQASGFAREALCWAVENGIINGVGGGALNPKGTATRAQAAQLLKNFMEKT